ncbi:GntR family transcriptional regulator [Xanthobacter sp. TB0136]|uniref:GntR family transcriptional regulator n=1 Tax=Xanthobacter sp. TB0136 TaxID=3459177 RepID=UPI0040397040
MNETAISKLPVRDRSLTEQVHDALCEMLLGGSMRPQDRTSIRELAEKLGVSAMPVRDAVSRLVAQGALVVERNRAITVKLLSAEEFRDLTEIRILLEREAVRKAVERVTPETLAVLEEINARFEEAMSDPSAPDAVQLNQQFHFRLYEAAGSPTLLHLTTINWLKAGPMINLDLGLPSRRQRNALSVSAHRAMMDGLRNGDPQAAADAVECDIRGAFEFILENTLKTKN